MSSNYETYDSDPTKPGEPLPVGAHEPDGEPTLPADPPGLPKPPDDLDYDLAEYVQREYDGNHPMLEAVRPDQATVPHARRGKVHDLTPRTVREALLVQVQQMAARERDAALAWAAHVRGVEEEKVTYLVSKQQREAAEEALRTLDLWIEEDDPKPQVRAKPAKITDDMIV